MHHVCSSIFIIFRIIFYNYSIHFGIVCVHFMSGIKYFLFIMFHIYAINVCSRLYHSQGTDKAIRNSFVQIMKLNFLFSLAFDSIELYIIFKQLFVQFHYYNSTWSLFIYSFFQRIHMSIVTVGVHKTSDHICWNDRFGIWYDIIDLSYICVGIHTFHDQLAGNRILHLISESFIYVHPG